MEDFVPVIDLFAGPGGLGEGFSAFTSSSGSHPFRVRLSIEMDAAAHATLHLRAFYRYFLAEGKSVPEDYYDHLRGRLPVGELYRRHTDAARAADEEAWHAELGRVDRQLLNRRIASRIAGAKHWVLIGGPPCQAYSLVGRSRMLGANPVKFLTDPRHVLYQQYLRIIADHRPPIFVMENVKGLLSATLNGRSTFERILEDLRHPTRALARRDAADLEYHIYSLSTPAEFHGLFEQPDFKPSQYLVQSEDYGIPQARHRVILLGVRRGMNVLPGVLAKQKRQVPMWRAIRDLPRIRSRITGMSDSADTWAATIRDAVKSGALANHTIVKALRREMKRIVKTLPTGLDPGSEFIESSSEVQYLADWFADPRLGGVCNHVAKRHKIDDIWRYFFVSSYGRVNRKAPKLKDFPRHLLPNHQNVTDGVRGSMFADRFRVQLKGRPSTTITSHISKDGHYFIHPEPQQCRCLTVREAARIQTFPDNYLFEGTRTEQYKQVGNAVPPYLAAQIARIVYDVLRNSRDGEAAQAESSAQLEHVADPVKGHGA